MVYVNRRRDGLTREMRLALCDAANGLLAKFGDHYQRQVVAPNFVHKPADVEALAERGLLTLLDGGEFAQPTTQGKREVGRIRKRRDAVQLWENMKQRGTKCRA